MRSVHEAGVVYSCVQPRNLVMGRCDHYESRVYLTDLKSAGKFFGARVEIRLHESISIAVGVEQKAVTPFSSVSGGRGQVGGRREDLELLM